VFELETMTKVRILDVRVLASKDRKPDDPPGAQLLLSAMLPSEALTMFDGFLPGMLYRKAKGAAQGKLEGLEGFELTSIGGHVKRMRWEYEQTGCEIEIDRGMGGKRNLTLSDCKVHRVSFSPREGGGALVQWTVDAPGLSDATWSKLPGLKATDIEMTMFGPEVSDGDQRSIDDETPPAPAAKKAAAGRKSATDEFIDRNAAATH
jgi:hypothetical protein